MVELKHRYEVSSSSAVFTPPCPARAAFLRSIDMIGTPAFVVDVLHADPLQVRCAMVNRHHAEAFGTASEAAFGFDFYEARPRQSVRKVCSHYARCVGERRPIRFEETVAGLEGERWFETTLTPWIDDGGAVTLIVGSSQEITARKTEATQAARRIAQLKRLTEDLRIYASMAAHDVRSPLATIESLISLVREDFTDRGDGKLLLLEACSRTAQQARGQIDELLRHADSLSVDEVLPEPVALDGMIRDVCALIDPEGRIDITWPDANVMTEGVTLQLVLRNLLSNAARHCAGRIAVELEPFHEDPAQMQFSVCDDGPGFDARTTLLEEGLVPRSGMLAGFGLVAVRHLVETRGGCVTIGRDVTGLGGARVSFTFPACGIGRVLAFPSERTTASTLH